MDSKDFELSLSTPEKATQTFARKCKDAALYSGVAISTTTLLGLGIEMTGRALGLDPSTTMDVVLAAPSAQMLTHYVMNRVKR